MNKLDIYNKLLNISNWIDKEIYGYKYSKTGDPWTIVNTPALESLLKLDYMITKLGLEIEEDL